MSKNNTRMQVKYLTVSALLCALGVIILGLGSLIEVIDMSVAVLASVLVTYAVIEIGGAYPWLIWIVTSVVAMLLLPLKSPVLFYALLLGFYPILKEKIERRFRFWPGMLVKTGIPILSFGAIYLVARLFAPALLEGLETLPLILLFLLLAFAAFYLYDFCLTRLITLYLVRLRRRFRIK